MGKGVMECVIVTEEGEEGGKVLWNEREGHKKNIGKRWKRCEGTREKEL